MKNHLINRKLILLISFGIIVIAMIAIILKILIKEDEVKIKLTALEQYGKVSASKNELFGLISSFTIDKNLDLYVADDAFKIVKKISKNGKVVREYGYGEGKGPGEFSAIHNIAVDTVGNLYVLDKINLNINVFDSLNSLISTLKLPFLPAQIIVISPMVVDVMGFPFTYEGDLIYRYNLLNSNSDDPQFTYCTRPTGIDSKMSLMSGNSGRLVKSNSGYIYYIYFYPYLIQKFSANGKLISSFEGHRKLDVPHQNSINGTIESNSGIRECAILPNDIIVLLVYQKNDNRIDQFFDVIDGKTGKFLGTTNCRQLGLEQVRLIRTDFLGNFYLDFLNPYPYIKKYKIVLEKK